MIFHVGGSQVDTRFFCARGGVKVCGMNLGMHGSGVTQFHIKFRQNLWAKNHKIITFIIARSD